LKRLTDKQKTHRKPYLAERDGLICIYCNLQLDPNDSEIDHLNDDYTDNQIENNVLCHRKCNLEKRNNYDYQIIAGEKLESNLRSSFKTYVEDRNDYTNSPEIEHNINVKSFVKQFITEKIQTDGSMPYADALNGLTYLCGEKFDHCSQVTIRRHLDAICSDWAPFMKSKNKSGKYLIVKREGN